MLETIIDKLLKNEILKENIPVITLVLLIWLLVTLSTIIQDYKTSILVLQQSLSTMEKEEQKTRQHIKELRLLCIDKEEYLRDK